MSSFAEYRHSRPPLRGRAARADAPRPQYLELKANVHRKLLNRLNLEALASAERARAEAEIRTLLFDLIAEEGTPLSMTEREVILGDVIDEVFGLGPLEPLLRDPAVSDILVNTYKHVYVERSGKLERLPTTFQDDKHLMRVIDRIVSGVGRRVDDSSPMVDARLPDGSRVNAIIPPLAVDGPLLSIRRFPGRAAEGGGPGAHPVADPRRCSSSSSTACARSLNMLISGGTGAGKTTLLNVLSGFISERERIVTIEDAAELQLHQEHVARLETRPPNVEGKGAVQPAAAGGQRPAYASRPHRRRRGARRGSAGHAAGDEHRPRRIADHRSRQHAARRAVPYRNDDRDGRHEPAGARHAPADRVGDPDRRFSSRA